MESKSRKRIAHHIVTAIMAVIYREVKQLAVLRKELKADLTEIVQVVLEDEGIE